MSLSSWLKSLRMYARIQKGTDLSEDSGIYDSKGKLISYHAIGTPDASRSAETDLEIDPNLGDEYGFLRDDSKPGFRVPADMTELLEDPQDTLERALLPEEGLSLAVMKNEGLNPRLYSSGEDVVRSFGMHETHRP